MLKTRVRRLTLSAGLVLLPACPGDIMFESASSEGSTGDDSTTNDPSSPPTPTTGTSSVDPTTSATDPVPTTTAPTTGDTTGDTGDATTTTDTTGDTDATTGTPTTLCERLGGPAEGGIQDLVGGFLTVVVTDTRINGYFLNDDVDAANLLSRVTAQLGALVGCDGVTYDGLDMVTAHMGLKISAADFADFADDFATALDAHQAAHPELSQDDKDDLLAELAAMSPEIVEDATSDATVYQRVGRKPAISNLVGAPDQPESFIGVVAADVAINTFFADSDFVRLHTCLTRQVAAIDGPIEYGHEVDSPGPGVDEGVSAASKCRDMLGAHQTLEDADMTTITIEDFLALVTDLGTAMTSAGVTPDDQTLVFNALAPLCDQIVVGAAEQNKCPGNLVNITVEAADLATKVPDDKYTGALTAPSMLCTTLTVADDGVNFVEDVALVFGADVTWIGDVTIKVVSPDMKVLTVLNRPTAGLPLPDDGSNGNGNDNGRGVDLLKKDRLTFKNGGQTPAAQMGSTLDDNFPNPGQWICQDDMRCAYAPGPGTGPGADFDDFRGDTAVGDWQVCVGDSGSGDGVTLDYLGLKLTKVKFDPLP